MADREHYASILLVSSCVSQCREADVDPFVLGRLGSNCIVVSHSPTRQYSPPNCEFTLFCLRGSMRSLRTALGIVWASPYSLVGLLIGIVGLCTGGQARVRGRTIEFHGGAAKWFVSHLPGGQFVLAFTLGHTILGQTDASLAIARAHELVHVRQFERWGPLLGPAYLLCSLVLWLRGRDPYRDNPFEREAFGETQHD